jgi:hypothetical protein
MKKVIVVVSSILLVMGAFGQQPPRTTENPDRMTNVQGLKIAYFTKQLNLNVEDAQKFWPTYFALDEELRNAKKQNADNILLQDEKILAIKKRYFNEFKKVLGSEDRANKVFVAERGFGNEVKKVLFERHKMYDMNQQPFGEKRANTDSKRLNEKDNN